MHKQFLEYYERELRFVRELGADFARRFPKVAGRLGITELACADPHVERLFEGFAFLAGRVHQRSNAEFPRFTESLMERVYPHYLGPTPSMTVVQFLPNPHEGKLAHGYSIPRGAELRARSTLRGVAVCEYRTAHPVELWPIAIESVEYSSVLRDIADLRLPSRESIRALLRIRLRVAGGSRFHQLKLRSLPLHLAGSDEKTARLYEALAAHARGLVLRWGPSPSEHAALSCADVPVRPLGLDDEHALLPCGPKAFQGYRLLQEYFAFPSRFHFVELCGLEAGVSRCTADSLELLVPLARHDASLEGAIELDRVLAFATPAINLFPRACDRVAVHDRRKELPIVPDGARPRDFEVHSVTRVAAFEQGSAQELELHALGTLRERLEHDGSRAHYVLDRRPRVMTFEESRVGQRSTYAGSEMYLSLVEPAAGSGVVLGAGQTQLGVDALCTNRDLPLLLSLGQAGSDFTLASGAPIRGVLCVAGPTAPRLQPCEGDIAWRLVSHLSLNYLSISEETGGADALREMLALYAKLGDPRLQQEADGIRGIRTARVIRPMPGLVPRTFASGLEIQLDCDEQAFSAHGVFTLASILSRFFANHASVHSFTETVLHTLERGEVYRWPSIAGLRHTL